MPALEELPSASSQAELVFTGTRDLLNFAADQVDQTAEALRMILEILDHVGESPRKTTRNRTRSDIMIGGMKQVIATTKNGAKLTPEQLAHAGVEPGERAVIEIRSYSEDEWIAETEGKVLSTEEFIEHLRRAPGPK